MAKVNIKPLEDRLQPTRLAITTATVRNRLTPRSSRVRHRRWPSALAGGTRDGHSGSADARGTVTTVPAAPRSSDNGEEYLILSARDAGCRFQVVGGPALAIPVLTTGDRAHSEGPPRRGSLMSKPPTRRSSRHEVGMGQPATRAVTAAALACAGLLLPGGPTVTNDGVTVAREIEL